MAPHIYSHTYTAVTYGPRIYSHTYIAVTHGTMHLLAHVHSSTVWHRAFTRDTYIAVK